MNGCKSHITFFADGYFGEEEEYESMTQTVYCDQGNGQKNGQHDGKHSGVARETGYDGKTSRRVWWEHGNE